MMTPKSRILGGSPYQTFSEFFSRNGLEIQSFMIDAGRLTTLVSKNGMRFTFFPFSLVDLFGNPVKGEVQVKLTELWTQHDMLLSAKGTMSEDRLMESAGMFLIEAAQNFIPLHLIQPVVAELPVLYRVRNPIAVKLFRGSLSSTVAFQSSPEFDWKPASEKKLPIQKSGNQKYFRFLVSELNWLACLYPLLKKGHPTMFTVKWFSIVDKLDDQVAFLLLEDGNALVRMYPSASGFTSFNIPPHVPAKVIVLGLKDFRLFYGEKRLQNLSNSLVHVELFPIEESDLLEALETPGI